MCPLMSRWKPRRVELGGRLRDRRIEGFAMSIVLENSASNALRIGELTLRLIAEASDQKPAILPLTSLAGRIVVLFVFGADCSTCKYWQACFLSSTTSLSLTLNLSASVFSQAAKKDLRSFAPHPTQELLWLTARAERSVRLFTFLQVHGSFIRRSFLSMKSNGCADILSVAAASSKTPRQISSAFWANYSANDG